MLSCVFSFVYWYLTPTSTFTPTFLPPSHHKLDPTATFTPSFECAPLRLAKVSYAFHSMVMHVPKPNPDPKRNGYSYKHARGRAHASRGTSMANRRRWPPAACVANREVKPPDPSHGARFWPRWPRLCCQRHRMRPRHMRPRAARQRSRCYASPPALACWRGPCLPAGVARDGGREVTDEAHWQMCLVANLSTCWEKVFGNPLVFSVVADRGNLSEYIPKRGAGWP